MKNSWNNKTRKTKINSPKIRISTHKPTLSDRIRTVWHDKDKKFTKTKQNTTSIRIHLSSLQPSKAPRDSFAFCQGSMKICTFGACYKVHPCIILSDSHFHPNPWHHVNRNVMARSFTCAIPWVFPIHSFILYLILQTKLPFNRIHSASLWRSCTTGPGDGVQYNTSYSLCVGEGFCCLFFLNFREDFVFFPRNYKYAGGSFCVPFYHPT